MDLTWLTGTVLGILPHGCMTMEPASSLEEKGAEVTATSPVSPWRGVPKLELPRLRATARATWSADPLLDLCELPLSVRAQLVRQPPANKTLDAPVLLELLNANRTHADPEARKSAKQAILAEALGA